MRRREFIAGLGIGAAWPLAGRAQQPTPLVGYLESKVAATSVHQVEAFRKGLSGAGFIEGRNVAIEFRWANGQLGRLPALVADLVGRLPSVIVTNFPAAPVIKAATSTIPIVVVSAADLVETGLAANLNRPGGNLTGVTYNSEVVNAKRLGQLHELVPASELIAILIDPNTTTGSDAQVLKIEMAARALARPILIVRAGTEMEIDTAVAQIVQAGARAVFVGGSSLFTNHRRQLVALTTRHALPASYSARDYPEIGGLISYGASVIEAYRRGGNYVARILKGEKPGDLPIELPTRYELVLNLGTAKALKINIPPKLLALADEVIE
jgi:putative tryptophan/tyrosine transport system substrate-binding protein